MFTSEKILTIIGACYCSQMRRNNILKTTNTAKNIAKKGCPTLHNAKVANPNIIISSNTLLIPRTGIGAFGDTKVPHMIAIKRGELIPIKILNIYPISK